MGLSEKGLCVKCEKGGKLLICSDIGCPIAVHENCLGFPARFDETGNFYCPYCLYRQAFAESRQERENVMSKKKALSTFIDEEMMDCDKRKQISANTKAKEQAQLLTTDNAVKSSFYNNEKRVDNTDVSNHSVRLEEDREEEFAPKSKSVSPDRGADGSLLDKSQLLFRHKTKSTPIVACGRDDVSCEEDTVQQFEVIEVRQGVKEQLSRQVDDQKFVRDVEHQQENDHLCDSPIVEEKTSKSTGDYSETLKENESRSEEEEHVAVQEHETSASSYEDESMPEIHLKAQQGVEAQYRRSKRIKQTAEHKAQSYSVDFSRRSSPIVRKSSTKIEKTRASRKLRKSEESQTNSPRNPFPTGRRTRLIWTEEEEEMLKEGVRTFSSTANKNLPWKKILDFGRHVFDSTRTPIDLKDKWRNILAKQD